MRADTGKVAFEVLFRESHTGFEAPRRELIREPGRWEQVWRTAFGGREPPPPVPEVAFQGHAVILAAMGPRPTGGHEVRVAGVRRTAEGLLVELLELSPGEGCLVAQALSSPAVAVAVAADEWETARFEVEAHEEPCG